MSALSPAFEPGSLGPSGDLAIRAWNLMDAQIDWSALDVIIEMLGVTDPEKLIVELVAIRDYQARQRAAGN